MSSNLISDTKEPRAQARGSFVLLGGNVKMRRGARGYVPRRRSHNRSVATHAWDAFFIAGGVIRGRAVLTRFEAVPTDGPQQAAALQVADCLHIIPFFCGFFGIFYRLCSDSQLLILFRINILNNLLHWLVKSVKIAIIHRKIN